jgi:hypothetical protein
MTSKAMSTCHHAKVYVLSFAGQPEPYGLECPFCVRDQLKSELEHRDAYVAQFDLVPKGSTPEPGTLPEVAGDSLPTTLAQFELRAKHYLADEQEKISPDSALIGLLCDAVRLARENERMGKAPIPSAGMDTPWPLHDVLAKLIEATEHLLDQHNCDTHGHEEYRTAAIAGKDLHARCSSPPPPPEHPLSSGDAIACIAFALQDPDTDQWPQLLRDCMHVIERMEGELLDAKRQRNAEVKLRQAAERAAQEYTFCGWISPNPGCTELVGHDYGGLEPAYSRSTKISEQP